MKKFLISTVMLLLLLPAAPAAGQTINGKILEMDLDAENTGYTVMKVWGSYYEMGYAHGYLLGSQIEAMVQKTIDRTGSTIYNALKGDIAATYYPSDVLAEIDGMVAGIMAANPGATVTAEDIMMLNTGADWVYTSHCRSHSCWGDFVADPVKTLSTRRLDYGSLYSYYDFVNILLCAYEPSDFRQVRWLNLILPGKIIAATAVNDYGTIVSIHDTPASGMLSPGPAEDKITRSIALRYMMTMDSLPTDLTRQADFVYSALQAHIPWTGSFLNYYAPAGNAGVITARPFEPYWEIRKPQAGYFGGEVIVTTNEYADGTTTPVDDDQFDIYYSGTKPKTLADHWGLLAEDNGSGAFQLSVEYRDKSDMTVWSRGRLQDTGEAMHTPVLQYEWQDLFPDRKIYGSDAYVSQGGVVEINLSQVTAQNAGNTLFETQAIDLDPETGYVYYFEWTTDGDQFAYWDPATGNNTIVRTYTTAPGFYAKHMAFAPDGTLYILDNSDAFYAIDKFSGDVTWLGTVTGLETGPYSRTGDMTFAPDGTLYVFTYQSLYTVDMATLAATELYSDMITSDGPIVWTGAGYCNGILVASDSHVQGDTGVSSIHTVDPATGEVIRLLDTDFQLNDLTSCISDEPQIPCDNDGDCDDGVFCNGAETCRFGTCEDGIPVTCDDGIDCTVDSCNETLGVCENVPDSGLCDDGVFCNGRRYVMGRSVVNPASDPCRISFAMKQAMSAWSVWTTGIVMTGCFAMA